MGILLILQLFGQNELGKLHLFLPDGGTIWQKRDRRSNEDSSWAGLSISDGH